MNYINRRQVIANFLEHEGPLTIRELCEKVAVDQTTLHADLAVMRKEGRVERELVEGERFKTKQSLYRWKLVA